MKRGPKLKTSQSGRKPPSGSLQHDILESPVDLNPVAQAEYQRLIEVLESGGTLERVDLICVANAARIKDLLDRAHRTVGEGRVLDPDAVALVNALTRQHRGLLRELGLTSQPSRTVFRAKPLGSERQQDEDPWAGKLKVSG